MYRGDQDNNALWCGLVHGEATPKFMTRKAKFDQYRDSTREKTSFPLPKLSHIDTTTGAEAGRHRVDRKSNNLALLLGLKHGGKLHFV